MRKLPIENTELSPLFDPFLAAFPTEALASLADTCQLFNEGFKQELNARKLNELVRRIVCGEEAAAKAILDASPELLLKSGGEATDYSGRQIKNLPPFQAALCAGDVDMCKMIKNIFLDYPEKTGGFDEMFRQFNEIFPWGLEAHIEDQKQNAYDFSAIVTAITNAAPAEVTAALSKVDARFTQSEDARVKPNDRFTLTEELNCFREQFTQKSHHEIVFNPQHLLRAFEVYMTQFEDWNWDKRDLFWRQVIGFVQRSLPACDAQAFAQGIYYLTEENEPLRRSFVFRYGVGSLDPVTFPSCSNLGFDYAVGCVGGRLVDGAGVAAAPGAVPRLQNLYRAKTHGLENLSYADQPAATGPVRNFIK